MKLALGALLTAGLAGCALSEDDRDWNAYLAELDQVEREGLLPFDPQAPVQESLPYWYASPEAFFDAWRGSGTGVFPHRPTWDAQRALARDMERRGFLRRSFSILEEDPPSDEAVDFLIAATSHVDPHRRALAVFILADVPRLGKRMDLEDRILPALLRALGDVDGLTRAAAAWAIGVLVEDDPEDPTQAAKALAPRLQDPEFFVRHNAACALVRLGQTPGDIVPILQRHLKHENWWIVAGATAALLKVGPPAKAAVPDLLATLRHPVPTCRTNALAALEAVDPAALKGNADAEKVRQELPRPPY